MLMWLKARLYRRGFRPKQGTILFSPSLALKYSWDDAVKTRRN